MEQRTTKQNAALHKMFGMLSDELNEKGLNMRAVLKPSVEIRWTPEMIKEYIWRPIQKAQLGKESTTELTTAEVDKVFATIQHHIGEKFEIELSFPSIKSLMDEKYEA